MRLVLCAVFFETLELRRKDGGGCKKAHRGSRRPVVFVSHLIRIYFRKAKSTFATRKDH